MVMAFVLEALFAIAPPQEVAMPTWVTWKQKVEQFAEIERLGNSWAIEQQHTTAIAARDLWGNWVVFNGSFEERK